MAFLESGEQVVAVAVQTHTIYHNFGRAPDFMTVVYRCLDPDNGYLPGEEVIHSSGGYSSGTGAIAFYGSAGVCRAVMSSAHRIAALSGGVVSSVTPLAGCWKTRLRAFWFTRTNQL